MINKKIVLMLATAFFCMTNCTPQCSQNSLNKRDIVCKNVQFIKDLHNVVQNDWQQLKIFNNEVQRIEWDEIPPELVNLENLDLSHAGELILEENGFDNLRNLKTLNLSSCKIETVKKIFLHDDNQLQNLDASWNSIENINSELKYKIKLLEVANFSHNQIQRFETEGDLPQLKVLHLDFNELKTISLDGYRNLNVLTLSDNLIEQLTIKSFRNLHAMEELILTSSPLSGIENRAFESMTHLTNLNLSANSLVQLSPDVFAGLSRLIQLDLNSNDLKELAHSQFQYLVKLQNLDISRNSLKSLNSGNFNGLANLRKLFIYENDIEEIKALTFSNMNSLDTLDLSYNAIEYLDADVFGPHILPRLRKLMLKSNNLKHIHPLAFASLPFLEYLSLGFNELTSLDVRMFSPMRRLEKLHLGNNLIETITSDVLESLTDIKELLLDKNRLSFLSDSNATFENMEKVSLEGNPWQCPCWDEMARWLDDRGVSYIRPHSPYFKGQKPLCVVTPVNFCVKNLRLVKEHKIEEIYNSG